MPQQPLLNTYGRLPVVFDRGCGPWLYDVDGQRYLDTFSGIAVCGLGHAHPAVTRAISDQSGKLLHCSNYFHLSGQQALAGKLCEISGMDGVFLANSGAEANEAALKLARLYGHNHGVDSPEIVVMERAFHGRTMATLSATGHRKVQAGFEPLMPGFLRVPFNDLDAIANVAASNPNIVAVLTEPIQGEGGIHVADPAWLQGIREICDHRGWLMMLDEVQTGNGRTGSYFAYQSMGVTPDVVTTAKGLGNGFPIGACLARGEAAQTFQPGHHGSTFGGNALACAAASAVIETIEQDNLLSQARSLGERMLGQLEQAFEGADYVHAIRGKGLMLGIELTEPCAELVPLAKTLGLLLNVTADRVIRLLPPLTLTDEEADFMIAQVIRIVKLYAADDRLTPRPATGSNGG
jgi:acetylornithine aminotransferase